MALSLFEGNRGKNILRLDIVDPLDHTKPLVLVLLLCIELLVEHKVSLIAHLNSLEELSTRDPENCTSVRHASGSSEAST